MISMRRCHKIYIVVKSDLQKTCVQIWQLSENWSVRYIILDSETFDIKKKKL